jgi:hypothetical protein
MPGLPCFYSVLFRVDDQSAFIRNAGGFVVFEIISETDCTSTW